ncbi:MAG: bifunctional isocitrate dehydrogenase kinase/phosphatase, partial [Candidatus Eutrophobiaceae bacterium]
MAIDTLDPIATDELKAHCSQIIYDHFILYNKRFEIVTHRAALRFAKQDWAGHQNDIVHRIDLYDSHVNSTVKILSRFMGERNTDKALWHNIRTYFDERLQKVPDAEFIRTFFNSITRRLFGIIGTNPQLEFLPSELTAEPRGEIASLNIRRYPYWNSITLTFETILGDFPFRKPGHSDQKKNARYITNEIMGHFGKEKSFNIGFARFEFIDSFFYQAARAYMVGRIIMVNNDVLPLIIAFKNEGHVKGINADAVLLSQKETSIAFGYTRSYYFTTPNSVIGAVHFLHKMLPNKPIDELYTVLGRVRQGKTERHRIFTQHLRHTHDRFKPAEGDTGLVMIVFTLPSYNLVFKVMRDQFGYPKTTQHEDVIKKYRLVSKHDRAGRLIDTQEFRNLELPMSRFIDSLRTELLQNAAKITRINSDKLLFNRIYIERRVRPLNLFLKEAEEEQAKLAIIDYGQALRDLAHTNIFPGDLLLKNFGVTPSLRVVFYDYDEVSLVTHCNFRSIPHSRYEEDEMRGQAWYHVNENDIFPEEFIRFLSIGKMLRETFLKYHSELLTAQYWREIRQKHLDGTAPLVASYETL